MLIYFLSEIVNYTPVVETVSPAFISQSQIELKHNRVETDPLITQFQLSEGMQIFEQRLVYAVLGLQLLFIYVWIVWMAKYNRNKS